MTSRISRAIVIAGFCILSTLTFNASAQSFITNNRLILGTDSNRSASVRLGDLDQDGDLDAVIANGRHWPEQNFLMFNQGRAKFQVVRPLGKDRCTTYACELADLDGDGDLDIVTGNDLAPCHIFLNDGQGHFTRHGSFGDIQSVRSLTLFDIDGDKDQDILMTCRGQNNQIFLNNGHADFSSGPKFGFSGDSSIDVACGDVNQDGHIDLLVANRDGQPNMWFINNGKLEFSQSIAFGDRSSNTRGVVVGDFNSDNRLDWAVANIGQRNRVYLGDGQGGVAGRTEFGEPSERSYCIQASDLNRDGHLDLVVGNAGQPNFVYYNNGDGRQFQAEALDDKNDITYGMSCGDLNGDGKPDIAVANSASLNRIFINRSRTNTHRRSKPASPTGSNRSDTNPKPKSSTSPADNLTDWPGFRGSAGRGVADSHPLPTTWNGNNTKGELTSERKNVVWQIPIPGLGHSSPVVVGQKLFLLTAVSSAGQAPLKVEAGGRPTAADDNGEQRWLLLCYDTTNGKQLWQRVLYQGKPRATRHAKATHANTSVAISGNRLVAFLGSEGLYCFDLSGELIWKQDLGVVNISKYGVGWGYSSSPAIHQGTIALVCDDPSNPYVAAFELETGKQIWRTSRQGDCERSWGTPLIHQDESGSQLVVNGWPWIVAYDLKTGSERWRLKGGGDNPVPTPFTFNGWFYITNAHGGPSPIYVIRPSARGDISDTTPSRTTDTQPNLSPRQNSNPKPPFVWRTEKGGAYMSTPVVYNGRLYVATTRGVVRCFDARTGQKLFEGRLGRKAAVTASLVAGDGKIYVPSENGKVYVLADSNEFNILAENEMDEAILATPAISNGTIFIRSTGRLTAVKSR